MDHNKHILLLAYSIHKYRLSWYTRLSLSYVETFVPLHNLTNMSDVLNLNFEIPKPTSVGFPKSVE